MATNVDLGSAALLLGAPEWAATAALLAGAIVALVAVVLSARTGDAELGYVVAVTATLLVSPVLWSHYLTHLIVPAAFLASRGRPWAIVLPLLAWLPAVAIPLVVLAALLLPFAAAKPPARAGAASAPIDRHGDARRSVEPSKQPG